MASHIEHADYDAPEMTPKRSGGALFNIATPILAAIAAILLTILVIARSM